MISILCFIIQTCAYLVNAGGLSASAEAAAANGGVANMGMIANRANPGLLNGVVLNGNPQLAQLVPIGQSLMIPQAGIPIGQAALPCPNGGLQLGQALPVAQPPLGIPQFQAPMLQAANGGGQLFAIVPQGNAAGALQLPMLNPGQQFQIVPVGGAGPVMQPAVGAQMAGNVGRRVKHSVPKVSSPTMSTPEAQGASSVPVTRPASLADALKLPVFSPRGTTTYGGNSAKIQAVPWSEVPDMMVEESSGSYGKPQNLV